MAAEEIKIDPSRVRLRRKKKRWTQDELSRAAGLSLRTIQRAEDSGRVSLATLKSLAGVLEVEAGELEAAGRISLPLLRGRVWATSIAGVLAIATAVFWVTGGVERIGPVAPALSKETVVVLPFVQLVGDDQASEIADVLTYDLILSLSKSGRANVVPERDSRAVSKNGESVEQVADAVSASQVVEGSVRSMGDRVRVTVQIVDVDSAAHLWSETYDRDRYDIDGIIPSVSLSIEAIYRH